MTFDEILEQVLELLQRQGRVSYRALKRRFNLDEDYLEDLKAELIDTQQVAIDEDGKVLVWTGEAETRRAPLREQTRAPRSYTPPHLAEKILTSRSALEGERKQVTVLFADLKGSMELLADRDPEEARQLLDPVLERMMAAVHRYEGTVNQVLGDGIMALFGAPIAHEDHAVRACYAALAMQASVKAYAAEVQRTQGVPLHIRVGVNAGEVVVRSIGSDLRMDYTAVGQTTHLAARMEQMAMPGSILITPEVLSLAEGYVQVTALGPVPVKGLSTPVAVYEVVGVGPVRSRLQAAAVRGLTRFVGRAVELDQLRQALERAGAGHGQLAALVGEPGVGKSRVVYEFSRSHRTGGWLVLESGSVSYGRATPYLPVIDLLKTYCGIEARDDPRRMRERVLGKVLGLDEALRPTLPALLALLDVPVEDPAWQALDPPQSRQRTLDAVKHLLVRESQVQPLLLVFEDLHWIDSETQALLDSLVESLPTARLLLLVNYRPEYQHRWGNKTYYTQLRLDPLPPASAEELLQALLGNGPGLEPLKRLLIQRTEGNPFFLEERVRTLVEIQVLVGERGAYRLAQALPDIQVPATVQAVLAARIDRLPPEDKRVLQTAAVVGTEVPFPLLEAIAELPEEPLRRALLHLQTAEFLYETTLFPELEYTFKHALTHEVAYGSLLQERRRTLHAQIVTALEALAGDRLTEQVERLAHHALRGEVWEKAFPYCRQAGAKAFARSAYREAVADFEQALVALQHLPVNRDVLEEAIDLRLDLRNALAPLWEYGRMLDILREAETVAETLDDQGRFGQVATYLTHAFFAEGDQDRALGYGHRALTIATALGDLRLQATVNARLGEVYYILGDYHQAMAVLGSSIASLTGDLVHQRFYFPFPSSVHSHAYLAWCRAERGDFAEGIVQGEEGVRIAMAVDQPLSLAVAFLGIGFVYLQKGAFDKAITLVEHGLDLCRTWNILFWFPRLASALGHAYALWGRVAEALPLLEQAVEQTAAKKFMADHSLHVARLSEACLLSSRIEDASSLARRALALSRAHKERRNEAWALRLLGEIASHDGPPDIEQAECYYQQALALSDELGMRPLLAHCHHGLGALYLRMGRQEQVRAELSAAVELYRAMEMTFWLTRAEATLAKVVEPG